MFWNDGLQGESCGDDAGVVAEEEEPVDNKEGQEEG